VAEQKLKERELESAAIIKGMASAFAILEQAPGQAEGRFVLVNDAFTRLTGVGDGEVQGRTLSEVWPGTEQAWLEAFAAVAQTGAARHFELFHGPTGKRYGCDAFRPGAHPGRFCVQLRDLADPGQFGFQPVGIVQGHP
jgi:PAS domain-containing protein